VKSERRWAEEKGFRTSTSSYVSFSIIIAVMWRETSDKDIDGGNVLAGERHGDTNFLAGDIMNLIASTSIASHT